MKSRNIILKAALGLGLISLANAETVYVTGSTAFRTAFNDAVFSLMDADGGCKASFSGNDFRTAGRAVIEGRIGGGATTIKTFWNGSSAGVQALAAPGTIVLTYITDASSTPATVTRSGTYPAFTYAGGEIGITNAGETSAANLAMSDVFQNSTSFTSPALTYDRTVAVVPFIFTASNNSDTAGASGTGFDNLTPLQAQLLWGSGRISLSLLTGNSADNKTATTTDTAKEVFAFGRSNDSGTRLTMLAEMGKGALSGVTQFSFNPTTNAWTNTGNAGTSAANQATWLADNDFSDTLGYAIGMLGATDAATAQTGGAVWLKWNGVPYSEANVRSGKYTVWGYQHLFASNSANAAVIAVADALAAEMTAKPGAAGIEISTMNVQRSAEGGLVDLND